MKRGMKEKNKRRKEITHSKCLISTMDTIIHASEDEFKANTKLHCEILP